MIKVLAVEDSPTQLESLRLILEAEGFEVSAASSAEAGLEELERAEFDLIISDIVMPGKSGYELCRDIKNHPLWRTTPVILLTSLSDPMDIIQGLEVGADNFITKPYEPAYLIERVRRFLETRHLRVEGKLKLGVEFFFLGKKFVVNSDKEQILDLLISTFEDIVRTNQKLQSTQAELSTAKRKIEEYARGLEGQVELSEQKYERLMAQANDAIMILNDQGRIMDTNRKAEELTGRSQEELVGHHVWEFGGDKQKTDVKRFEELLRNRRVESEAIIIQPDGTQIDVEYSASVAEVGNEKLILTIVRDVTERKKAEESRALLATIVETSDDAIFAASYDGVFVSWNRGAEAIFGYSAEEIIGESPAILVPEDRKDEFRILVEKVRNGETIRHFRTRRRRKDGQLVDLSLTVSPITDEQGEVVGASAIARDIMMEKALEEQKRLSSLGRVAATIAHEMNNVLMGIQPFNEVLRMRWGHEPDIESISERISNALRRGKHITGEILRFTKPSQPNRQPIDLNELVRKHEPEYREAIGSAIDFEILTDEGDLIVAADQYQLQQVITNLVLNARDATPPDGRIELKVGAGDLAGLSALDGRKEERFASIVVSDTGVGMPKDVADRIFEPLFTTKQNGTGIGLAVAHQIVTSHDGIISLETEPGHGTSFVVTLPLAESRYEDAQAS